MILAPRPGIEPAPPALEGEVITTGPPGKSLHFSFLFFFFSTFFLMAVKTKRHDLLI